VQAVASIIQPHRSQQGEAMHTFRPRGAPSMNEDSRTKKKKKRTEAAQRFCAEAKGGRENNGSGTCQKGGLPAGLREGRRGCRHLGAPDNNHTYNKGKGKGGQWHVSGSSLTTMIFSLYCLKKEKTAASCGWTRRTE